MSWARVYTIKPDWLTKNEVTVTAAWSHIFYAFHGVKVTEVGDLGLNLEDSLHVARACAWI